MTWNNRNSDALKLARLDGAPADLTDALASEVFDAILARVATGDLLNDAAASYGVTGSRVRAFAALDPEAGAAYRLARESQAHALSEELLQVSRGADLYSEAVAFALEAHEGKLTDDGLPVPVVRSIVNSLAHSQVARDRLRVDTLRWYVGKIAPTLYSDQPTADAGRPSNLADASAAQGVVFLPAEQPDVATEDAGAVDEGA